MKIDARSYLKALSKCRIVKTKIEELYLIKDESELLNVYSEFSRMLGDKFDLLANVDGENDWVLPVLIPEDNQKLHLFLIVYFGPRHSEQGYVGMLLKDFVNRNIDYLNEYLGPKHVKVIEECIYDQLVEHSKSYNLPTFQVSSGPEYYAFLQEK